MELKLHLYSITQMFAPRPSMLKPTIFDVRSLLNPWVFKVRHTMLKPNISEIQSSDAKALDL